MSKSIDVTIEIPRGTRNKYEYDHDLHVIRLKPPPHVLDGLSRRIRLLS